MAVVVAFNRTFEDIQTMINSAPQAEYYYSDGFSMYKDLCYFGEHIVAPLKSQTYTAPGINADIRHYIAGLQRKMRTFFRSITSLTAVLKVFVDAFNRFGEYKAKYQKLATHKSKSKSRLHKYNELPLGLTDFL